MHLAWLHDHVETMVELARYTEPDEEVKESDIWEIVQTEQDRRWGRTINLTKVFLVVMTHGCKLQDKVDCFTNFAIHMFFVGGGWRGLVC